MNTLYTQSQSMFRNSPVGFILMLILSVPFVVGIPVMFFWWLKCKGTVLTVTDEKTILRKGIFSKHENEVYHSDVRNVQVSQNLLQRLFGVGYIGIASAGHAGMEIEAAGIPAPGKVKELINIHRKR
jgi:uncharacterized membrane protein YdbT with pleckstrin-like domain